MSQYFELLSSNVYDKKNIVTYRWLSRKLNVNVNQAKKILYEYKINENDKIHCIYCISGQLKKDNALSIELIPEEKLEDTKKKFEHFFIHIYSIEAQDLKELDPLVAENYNIINDVSDNPQNYSMIHCNNIHKKEKELEVSSIDIMEDVKPEPSIFDNSKSGIKEIKKEKQDFFKKTANNKKKDVKVKDTKKTFFDKFKTKSVFEVDKNVSNKQHIKKESKNSMNSFLKESTVKIEPEKTEKKIESEENKIEKQQELTEEEKRKIMEVEKKNMEHEKEIEEENERLRHLFDDDDISSSISKPAGNRRFVLDDEEDDDDDENHNNNSNIITNEEKPKKLVKSDDTREKGRKRYRVVKSKTYVDEKGYFVTEDVSDWESESDHEEKNVQSIKQKSLFDMHNNNNNSRKRASLNDDDDDDENKKIVKKKKSSFGAEKTQKSILNFFGKR
ncbi:hypothetical protein BCR32DRAFT_292208 [Anaeromyces robustus]|uniref:DNA polymerase delta subunit 3 n=1 Tax=Anaeromyces robustus TaxID=1754192 RepID=A0A1Y1XBI0_9FUNG|nr:hypothetical protein BCR32DRAFT_292208 [Anaeromyces robustus]|eukprot:ORX83099.1 hypothetical protein BCR32DRAFT_292208 [Anaeromyces robustus]